MRLFACQNCSQLLFFENETCENCKKRLGYLPDAVVLSALDPSGDGWLPMASPTTVRRFCANAEHGACNWLLPANAEEPFCAACRHNLVVPDLSINSNLVRWRKIETAKHHLFYTLLRLGLPLRNRADDAKCGLGFQFLSDEQPQSPPVMTGHDHGIITLDVAEADDGMREQRRHEMGEPYRTLLGHFRHEIGHYFWDELVDRGGRLDDFRASFGDERPDYGAALREYYANGPKPDWQNGFVSAYATAHPWEDFAETWAHYFHMVDTLEMAGAFGLSVRPQIAAADKPHADLCKDAAEASDISSLVEAWLPVTIAVNSLNRCMGQPDLYPFVLSQAVIGKLGFIHGLIRQRVEPQSGARVTRAGR